MIELHRDSPRVQSEAIKALALVASTRARGGIADTAERVQTEDQSVPVSCLRAEAVLPGRSPPVPPQSGKLDPAGVEAQTQSRASIVQCPEWLKARGTLLAMDIGRRDALKGLHFGSAALVSSMVSRRDASADVVPNESESDIAVRTAVQGVCAWPNCQILPDGSILALIFNQPCHGLWEGDLDCWASEDGGSTWRFRGRAAQHEQGTNRMNCATGIAADGNVVVLCSGWADRRARGKPVAAHRQPLRAWVCRSDDSGRTWTVGDAFPAPPQSGIGIANELIPFGNIRAAEDGSLRVAAYLRREASRHCYMLQSHDDGRTWTDPVTLHSGGNETDILHLGGGRWLAVCREFQEGRDVHLELFGSSDDGKTWTRRMPLTLPRQVTGHLTRLADGRILLSHGNRCWNNFGVDVRISEDEGVTWSPPVRIADCPRPDCGYPSSVQRSDGIAVTAYYTQVSEDFHYEMRTATWNPSSFSAAGTPRG